MLAPYPRHLTTAGRAGPGSVITSHGPSRIARSPAPTPDYWAVDTSRDHAAFALTIGRLERAVWRGPQGQAPAPHGLGIGRLRTANTGELAVHQIGAHLALQYRVTPVADVFEDQQAQEGRNAVLTMRQINPCRT